MNEFSQAFIAAGRLLTGFDPELFGIIGLSLQVSLAAVVLASLVGLPLGALVALERFPGRPGVVVALNALMGLPPVVVGLCVYLLLSRAGPLGEYGLLFTPTAMVIAQAILVTPLIAALARQAVADLAAEYGDSLPALGAGRVGLAITLLWEGRVRLLTSVLAGFGRAIAEVGAVIIVGGNIAEHTRVMTTAIALETSKGNLGLALGLGIVLVTLSLAVNASAFIVGTLAQRRHIA
jgi:tungstate transport system permease protein